jgi:AraC-like DNA-binding protein
MPNVEWLLREAADEHVLRVSEFAALDDERWRAVIERLEIGPGLRVFLTDAEARRDVTVEARDNRADQWLGSQVTVTGRAEIDFLDGTRTHAAPDHAVLFRPSRRKAAYGLRAGARFRSAGFGLAIDRIVRLFDDDVPDVLQGLLAADIAVSRVLGMRGDRIMRSLAENLFGRGLNGPLRILMIEGAVIQLLALQAARAAHAAPSRSRRSLSPREQVAVREARERLLSDMRHPPTIGELATAVGMTEKRLNSGFRVLFGTTVFETLRNERLEHARIALVSGGASMKQVAFRVGYDHVTNFINAFTARFGAPPRRYAESCGNGAETLPPRPER